MSAQHPVLKPEHADKTQTDVFYTLADGTKGSYRAATADLADAIEITTAQLIQNALDDGLSVNQHLFTITKAELVLDA